MILANLISDYLIVGGFLFWIGVAAAIVALWSAVVAECAGCCAAVTAVSAFILLVMFGAINVVQDYLPATWYGWVALVVGQFTLGLLWSFFRFYKVYANSISELRESYQKYNKEQDWNEYLERNAPRVSDMKEAILVWIVWWEISAIAYFTTEFLTDIAKRLYEIFKGVYENIAKRIRDSFMEKR